MGKDNAFSQNPELAKLLRECDRGDDLFLEGSVGNTVFLILQGSVELKKKVGNHQITIGKVEAGAFIGEKALLQDKPFPRFASARAASIFAVTSLRPTFSRFSSSARKRSAASWVSQVCGVLIRGNGIRSNYSARQRAMLAETGAVRAGIAVVCSLRDCPAAMVSSIWPTTFLS